MPCTICQQKGHNKRSCKVEIHYDYDDCGIECRINPQDEDDWQPIEPHCLNCGHSPADCECRRFKAAKWFDESKGKWRKNSFRIKTDFQKKVIQHFQKKLKAIPAAGKLKAVNHNKGTQQQMTNYNLAEGLMSSSFFNSYIKGKCSKKTLEAIKENWSDVNEDEGEPLPYQVFGISNKQDTKTTYSECWLLECSDGFAPVIVSRINTSSCYAMCRCGMDNDEEEEQEEKEWTIDEICEMFPPFINKTAFKKLLAEMSE